MSAVPPHDSLPRPNPSPSPPTSPPCRSELAARLREAGCVFAEDEAELLISAARTAAELAAMADRRVAGFPLEHVLGWAEFCGMRMVVEPGVFVPRRRSEFLVRQAAAGTPPGAVVVDLCCGSGALGAALAAAVRKRQGHRPYRGIELHAADIDPAAVRCARRNVAGVRGRVHQGDLYAALPAGLAGRIEVLLANVPYVPSGSVGLLPAEARVHEPRVALDGGADGLDILRRVTAAAPRWLAPGGRLLVETGEGQVEAAAEIMAACGLAARVARCEELGATVLTGTSGGVRRTGQDAGPPGA